MIKHSAKIGPFSFEWSFDEATREATCVSDPHPDDLPKHSRAYRELRKGKFYAAYTAERDKFVEMIASLEGGTVVVADTRGKLVSVVRCPIKH